VPSIARGGDEVVSDDPSVRRVGASVEKNLHVGQVAFAHCET
jgi:hypothetical protein